MEKAGYLPFYLWGHILPDVFILILSLYIFLFFRFSPISLEIPFFQELLYVLDVFENILLIHGKVL